MVTDKGIGRIGVRDEEQPFGSHHDANINAPASIRQNTAAAVEDVNHSGKNLYSEKLEIDARSRAGCGKKNKSRDQLTAPENNAFFNEKMAIDTRSRGVRKTEEATDSIMPGAIGVGVGNAGGTQAVAAANFANRKGMIDARSRRKEQRHEQPSTTFPPEDLQDPTQQEGVAHQEQGEEDAVEVGGESGVQRGSSSYEHMGESDADRNLIVAYTVEEEPNRRHDSDQSVLYAEPLSDENTKIWRRATFGLLVCLIIVGVSVGVAVPLSTNDSDGSNSTASNITVFVPATESPSRAPSHMPSATPSVSTAPSSEPSMAPSMVPTADFCNASFSYFTCTELRSGIPCTDYEVQLLANRPASPEACSSDPVEIYFYYDNGFSCADIDTDASDNGIHCEDYNNGTSAHVDVVVRVESATTTDLVYFDNHVSFRDRFTVAAPNLEPIADMFNISIYSDTPDEILLQNMLVPFDCVTGDAPNFVPLGSLQYLGFRSIEQGYQPIANWFSTSYTMVLTTEIRNEGVSPMRLSGLDATFSPENEDNEFYPVLHFDRKDLVVNEAGFLNPGSSLDVEFQVDHVRGVTYLVLLSFGGLSEAGAECGGATAFDFAINSTFEGSLVTPTSPTSPDENQFTLEEDPNASCDIESSIHCVGRTVHGSVDCRDLTRCRGLFPSQIQFILEGGGCTSSESPLHTCTDESFNGVGDSDQQVFVLVRLQDEVILNRVVDSGAAFVLESIYGLGPFIEIEISTAGMSRLLQRQKIWTCDDGFFLLGEKFGAMRLNSSTTSIASRPLTSLNLHLFIENQGSVSANVTSSVVASTGNTPSLDAFEESYGILRPQENRTSRFFTARTDDFVANYDSTFSWTASIFGVTRSGIPCQDTATADFSSLASSALQN